MFNNIYKGKRVLVTGNTGFKGSWISLWLKELGAQVFGISNAVPTEPAMFNVLALGDLIEHHFIDVRDAKPLSDCILQIQPDFIFHLAAQPIVGTSYSDPVGTIATNTMGTVHVLDAARNLSKNCVLVMITSDKCYENVEWLYGYREVDRLGGKDIYSASKAAAEVLIYSYFHSFIKHKSNLRMVSVRAGNVIGGGDWAEKRLVPDCIRAWTKEEPVVIRHPASTRPWQHVLEPISGYLSVGQHLAESEKLNGEAFNFGPPSDQVFSVKEVLDAIALNWKLSTSKEWVKVETGTFHEAGLLKLSCEKANFHLQWRPVLDFDQMMSFTSSWYWEYYHGNQDMTGYTQRQIATYISLAEKRNLAWIQ
ncbi:CDP-glucose 4,6-dehydratase [Chryseosolibacter indicus]|nr:CDP-glucose 4,6-dehydratase [Chryseosolibacter indicus]